MQTLSSKDIDTTLQQSAYSAPIHPNKTTHMRNHIKIECKTTSDLNILKNDIQQHDTLNRKLNAVTKALSQQKIILLEVPTTTTEKTN